MKKTPSSQRPQGDEPGQTHFFREAALFLSETRWLYLSIAFAMAITLWYLVTVRNKVETWVDAKVEFKNIPAGLMIRDGLIKKASVRVRAAQGLSQGLAERDISVAVDLASLTPGNNIFAITNDMLPFRGAYEIMDISPPRIQLYAEQINAVELPLREVFEGSLSSDFYIQSTELIPKSVSVSGPVTVVDSLSALRVTVPLESRMRAGLHEMLLDVVVPESVTVTPAQVAMNLLLGVRMKTVRIARDVQLDSPAGVAAKLTPTRVVIEVDIPESQAGRPSVLAMITALASLPQESEKSGKMAVRVLLPENARLKSVLPSEVMVSLTQ